MMKERSCLAATISVVFFFGAVFSGAVAEPTCAPSSTAQEHSCCAAEKAPASNSCCTESPPPGTSCTCDHQPEASQPAAVPEISILGFAFASEGHPAMRTAQITPDHTPLSSSSTRDTGPPLFLLAEALLI